MSSATVGEKEVARVVVDAAAHDEIVVRTLEEHRLVTRKGTLGGVLLWGKAVAKAVLEALWLQPQVMPAAVRSD